MKWTQVCKGTELEIGKSRCIEAEGKKIALFRTEKGVFALDDHCPHRSGPLSEGWRTGETVSCPWHQWVFNLKDGLCVNIPGQRVRTFPVEEREGALWIGF